ncbi:MAG: sodium/solute symporter [Bacteroidaceae bacterium]|nr:sodium/solute symporter [Bacteroidaceae bacterium]
MILKKLSVFVALMIAFATNMVGQNDNKFNEVNFNKLPELCASESQGVSAPFAGVVDGDLIVVGGCNFPNTPAAEGGQKVYYGNVYRLANDEWVKEALTLSPVAYGMSVQVPEGLVCIGGQTPDTLNPTLATVTLITKQNGQLSTVALPSLPEAIHSAGAGFDGTHIYVAGGERNAAYRLAYPGGTEWETLPSLPGRPRVQPAGVVQSAAIGKNFYVFGGFAPRTESDTAFVHSDGLFYDSKKNEWIPTTQAIINDSQRAIVGASAIASGVAHIVIIGGVNKEVFLNALNRPEADYLTHPVEWYQFNDELLIYQTITDAWVTEAKNPALARAGAAVVPYNGEWVVINGESKPGVRSAEVTSVKLGSRVAFGWLNWLVLAIYLIGMLGLGYFFMLRESSSEDFFKGGGRIPWWAAGISIYATMLSAITYMAIPAKAYATDWTYYPMLITILIVSFPVVKYYLPYFRKLNLTSAYEYLEVRFNAPTRFTASALFIIFMVARTALVLYLPSLALTAVTGIDIYLCIILMGVITIIYCTMGGVEAVVWGDVVQGIILVGGAILAAVYLMLNTEGGFTGFVDLAIENDKFRLFDYTFDFTSATIWVIILGGLANNLISYTSDQTVIQRYMTTKDEKGAGRGIMLNGVMSVFISVSFYLIGTGLYTFFKTHPAELDYTMAKSDAIFPFFMTSQMPAGLAGLLIAAIFAATMSTISSNINSISTAFSVDFYKRFVPTASDHKMLSVARWACMISGLIGVVIALLMATWEILSLLDYFNTILGLLSSGLGGLFFIGIFCKRVGGIAAMTGFIVGEAVVFWMNAYTPTSFLLYGFIGMAVCIVVANILSFIPGLQAKQK